MKEKKKENGKSLKTWGIFLVLLGILCGASLDILRQWDRLSDFSNQSGLRYQAGGLSGDQIEAYQKSRKEEAEAGQGSRKEEAEAGQGSKEDMEIAAWKRVENQTFSLEELGRSAEGTMILAEGNLELVFPGGLKSGAVPLSADEKGCLVSSGLAMELFGSEEVLGNSLEISGGEPAVDDSAGLRGTKLTVRGILDQKEPLLVMRQEAGEEQMPYVEIRAGEPPAPRLAQTAACLGLFGEAYVFNGSFYVSIARLLISLPAWFLFFFLSRRFLQWCKGRREKYWAALAGRCLVCAGVCVGILLSVSVTSDFIPARWSDFGFWKEKVGQIVAWGRNRRNFPPVFWEEEALGCVKRIALWAAVGLGCVGGMVWNYNLSRRWAE